jgi:hypothetical protein
MLYKHTTQKLYICDPQMQLNNFFTITKISLHVSAPTGHLQVIFLKISYFIVTHPSSLQVWGYLLLLNLYVYNAKEAFRYIIFYIRIIQNAYNMMIVLWSGNSDSYDEKIIILERANLICILYEFCSFCKATFSGATREWDALYFLIPSSSVTQCPD